MRKVHYLAIVLTTSGICLVLLLLLAHNSAWLSPLEIKLRKVGVMDDPAVAKKHLDLIQDRTIKFQNGRKLTFAKDFLYHGRFPTRLIEYEAGVWSYRVYFILTPDHFYQIGVGGTRIFVVSGRTCGFMTSFKVIE